MAKETNNRPDAQEIDQRVDQSVDHNRANTRAQVEGAEAVTVPEGMTAATAEALRLAGLDLDALTPEQAAEAIAQAEAAAQQALLKKEEEEEEEELNEVEQQAADGAAPAGGEPIMLAQADSDGSAAGAAGGSGTAGSGGGLSTAAIVGGGLAIAGGIAIAGGGSSGGGGGGGGGGDILPVAADDSFTTNEDTLLSGTVATNDPSQGDAPAVYSVEVGDGPANGSVTMNADGSFSYTPNANFNGTDSFTYTITDADGDVATAVATIGVNAVNDAPVAVADIAAATEDGAILNGSVAGNDSDAEGDTLTFAAAPGQTPVAGLAFNADGSYTFNPSDAAYQSIAAGATQAVTFNYTVSDPAGASDSATLTINVTGTNDAPIAVADTNAATEDGAVVTGDVGANDTDVDTGDTLSFAAAAGQGAVAGLTFNTDGSYSFDPTNAAYDSLSANETQQVNFQYQANDDNGASDTATLSITVTGANDAPTAVNDTETTDEDSATTLTVLANDSDPDTGDTLTVQSVDTTGTLGTVTINPNGTITYDPNSQFEALTDGDTATDTFTYTVSDGTTTTTATATVTINGVNDNVMQGDNIVGGPGNNFYSIQNANLLGTQIDGAGEGTVPPGDSVRHVVDSVSPTFDFAGFVLTDIETFEVTADGAPSDQFDFSVSGPAIFEQDDSSPEVNYDLSSSAPINRLVVANSSQDVDLNFIKALATGALPRVEIVNPTDSNRINLDIDNADVGGATTALTVGVGSDLTPPAFGTNLGVDQGVEILNLETLADNSQGFALNTIQGTDAPGTGTGSLPLNLELININAIDGVARWDLQIGAVVDGVDDGPFNEPSTLPPGALVVDASASTGAVDLTLSANVGAPLGAISLTGGSGDDRVQALDNLTIDDTLDGGTGDDVLAITTGTGGATGVNNAASDLDGSIGFETVQLLNDDQTLGLTPVAQSPGTTDTFTYVVGAPSPFAADTTVDTTTFDATALDGSTSEPVPDPDDNDTANINAGAITNREVAMLGGSGDDTLIGGNSIDGDGDADTVDSDAALEDTINGNEGSDVLIGSLGDDLLIAGDNIDFVPMPIALGGVPDPDHDSLSGGMGDDILRFEDSQLTTGLGLDTASGGLGADTVEIVANSPGYADPANSPIAVGAVAGAAFANSINGNFDAEQVNIVAPDMGATQDVGLAIFTLGQTQIGIDASVLGADNTFSFSDANVSAFDVNLVGGAGDDFLTFADGALGAGYGLTSTDTVAAGNGDDHIITIHGIADAAFTNVSSVEELTLLGSGVLGNIPTTIGGAVEAAGIRTVNLDPFNGDTLDASAFNEPLTVRIGTVDFDNDGDDNGFDDSVLLIDPAPPAPPGNLGDDSVALGSGDDTVEANLSALTVNDSLDGGAGANTILLDNEPFPFAGPDGTQPLLTGPAVDAGVKANVDLDNVTNIGQYTVAEDGERFPLAAPPVVDADNNILNFEGGAILTTTELGIDASAITDTDDSFTVTIGSNQVGNPLDQDYAFNIIGSDAIGDDVVVNTNNNDVTLQGNGGDDRVATDGQFLDNSITFDGGADGGDDGVGQFIQNDLVAGSGDAILYTEETGAPAAIIDQGFENVSNVEVLASGDTNTVVGINGAVDGPGIQATLGNFASAAGINTIIGSGSAVDGDNVTFANDYSNDTFVNLAGNSSPNPNDDAGQDTINAGASAATFTFFGDNDSYADGDILTGGNTGGDQAFIGANGTPGGIADFTNVTRVETITVLNDNDDPADGFDDDDSTIILLDTMAAVPAAPPAPAVPSEIDAAFQTIDGSRLLALDGEPDVLELRGSGATANLSVLGGAGEDILVSGAGADTIDGNAGDDLILANGGPDVLTGDTGADRFLYDDVSDSAGLLAAIDTITDFTSGTDVVDARFLDLSGSPLMAGDPIDFEGNAVNFADAQSAVTIASGELQAVFQQDENILWFDVNDDGTLDGNDLRIRLDGVTSLVGADVLEGFLVGQVIVADESSVIGFPVDEEFVLDDTPDVPPPGFHFTVDGGLGNDTVTGSASSDDVDIINVEVVNAGTGDDTVDTAGAIANVTINGEAGNDDINVNGPTTNASLTGGTGSDDITVNGKATDTTIQGNAGADNINVTGTIDPTLIEGGAGNDIIMGGNVSDNSTVRGQGDDDQITLGQISGSATVEGNQGDDDISVVSVSQSAVVDSGDATVGDTITINGVINDNATVKSGNGADLIDAGTIINDATVTTGVGNDTINAAGTDVQNGASIDAGADNDSITTDDVGTGATVAGGANNDTIAVDSLSNATIDGGIETGGGNGDTITVTNQVINAAQVLGNQGDDSITTGNVDASTINGGSDNDTITTGDVSNSAQILGGNGIVADTISVADVTGSTVDGGQGDDSIDADSVSGGAQINGGAEDDTIVVDSLSNATIDGGIETGSGNGDTITVTNDVINGAQVLGNQGNDSITTGNVDASTISGGTDGDTITTGNVSNSAQILGDNNNDSISVADVTGSTVDGGQGDDSIDADTVSGGAQINGGVGNDTIVVDSLSNATIDGGIETGGGNGDSITVTNDVFNGAQVLGNQGNDTIGTLDVSASEVNGGDGADSITTDDLSSLATVAGGTGDDTIDTDFVSNSEVNGGGGADSITTNDLSINATVDGGSGNDTITTSQVLASEVDGGGGLDVINVNGEASNATVNAGDGNDAVTFNDTVTSATVNGALGMDTVTGSAFADKLTLNGVETLIANAGDDTVTANGALANANLGTNNDALTLNSATTTTATIEGGANTDTVTGSGAADNLTLTGVESLAAGAGADNINADADLVIADLGDDNDGLSYTAPATAAVDGGINSDAVIGSTGDDALVLSNVESLDANLGNDTVTADGDLVDADLGLGDDKLNYNAMVTATGTVDGGGGMDTLSGSNGNDSFAHILDFETIQSGAGDDTVTVDDNLTTNVSLGNNDDILTFTGGAVGVTIDGGANSDIVNGSANGDTLNITAVESIATGAGGDSITLDAANLAYVTIDGGGLTDMVFDSTGDDLLNLSDVEQLDLAAGGNDIVIVGTPAPATTIFGFDPANDVLANGSITGGDYLEILAANTDVVSAVDVIEVDFTVDTVAAGSGGDVADGGAVDMVIANAVDQLTNGDTFTVVVYEAVVGPSNDTAGVYEVLFEDGSDGGALNGAYDLNEGTISLVATLDQIGGATLAAGDVFHNVDNV